MNPEQLSKKRIVTALILGTAILVVPALIVYQWFFHVHPVYKKGLSLIQQNPTARNLLGKPVKPAFWIYGRSWKNNTSIHFNDHHTGIVHYAIHTQPFHVEGCGKTNIMLINMIDRALAPRISVSC